MALFQSYVENLQSALNLGTSKNDSLAGINFKVQTRTRDLNKGDFYVLIRDANQNFKKEVQKDKNSFVDTNLKDTYLKKRNEILSDFAEEIITESVSWDYNLMSFTISDDHIEFMLDRPQVISTIIKEILDSGSNYGSRDIKEYKELIILHFGESCHSSIKYPVNLGLVRSLMIMQHIKQLLLKMRCNNVRCCGIECLAEIKSTLEEYEINNIMDSQMIDNSCKACEKNFTEKIRTSKYRDFDFEKTIDPESTLAVLNLWSFIDENRISIGYDKNINLFLVEDDSTYLEELDRLQSLITNLNTKPLIVHIVAQNRDFRQQQIDLLWQMCSEEAKNLKQVHLVHGQVGPRKGGSALQLQDADEFFRMRVDQVRIASEHKCGDSLSDAEFESTIHAMAVAGVKFELLSTVFRNEAKIDLNDDIDGSTDARAGSFVMYNCARLEMLLMQFEAKVNEGYYPKLPGLSEIDFSLLKDTEEWELVYNYLIPFPKHLRDSVGDLDSSKLHINIHTHMVCNFLTLFSRLFSSYYRRVRVLVEPRPHLLPLIYARIYLLKAAKQVFHIALRLLSIEPLLKV